MKPLSGHRVLALDTAQTPLARFLASLGAQVDSVAFPELLDRIPGATFLIERQGLENLKDSGYERERIERANPRLIHVSVTTFGSNGPRSRWQGSELVASAMAGTLRLTGDPDREPVKEALDACFFHADMVAAAGALAAFHALCTDGLGQHVDIAAQEVAFSRCVNSILVWQFDKRKLHRVGGALNYGLATVRCIWPLADGWCFHTLMTGRFGAPANQALSDWIDAAGLDNPLRGVDWLKYNRSTLDPNVRRQWESAIAAFFHTRTKAQIATEGRQRGINATVVGEPRDALADPHLAVRDFWRSQDGCRVPGRFFRVVEGAAVQRVPARSPGARPGPLAGVRVLDFSWALVGSITTKVLGDLGADVIKVESRTRACLSRLDVQIAASKAGNFDDKPWFAHLNGSKRSLALDMKKPESREVLEPLIDWADLVVENFSPGTMAKLGLDYERLCRRNPSIIMVSGSVYGQTGPLASEWGVDGTGAALSGRTYLTGWPDRDPVIPGAVPYGDVIVPYVMAAAAAAALSARHRTGRGCQIDASMYEICVQQMYEAVCQQQTTTRPERSGNHDPGCRQGVYPVAGVDRWIAITCRTDAEWQLLHSLAGGSADLADWTAGQEGGALMEQLQAAGIASGVVQDIQDLFEQDPMIAARGSLTPLDHPLLGRFGHVRTPVTLSRSQVRPFRAPSLGEHSAQVAVTLAGLEPGRVRELELSGVFQ